MIDPGTVYFVGSGPGDPDLITLRAKLLVETADVIVYSGSLLNPEVLKYAKKDAELIDAALIDRERIYEILKSVAEEKGGNSNIDHLHKRAKITYSFYKPEAHATITSS